MGRVRELQRAFRLRVVLVHVDVDDPVAALGDVTALTLRSDCTLICAWSYEARLGLALLRRAAPGFPAVKRLQCSPNFRTVQDVCTSNACQKCVVVTARVAGGLLGALLSSGALCERS